MFCYELAQVIFQGYSFFPVLVLFVHIAEKTLTRESTGKKEGFRTTIRLNIKNVHTKKLPQTGRTLKYRLIRWK